MSEVALQTYFVCDLFCCFSDSSLALVLGAVNCLQKYVVLPFLLCETANFLHGWGVTHPHTPFRLRPCILLLISTTLSLRCVWVATVAYQGAFHFDPTLDIFFTILLLRHDKSNIEMAWSSHTPKPSWFLWKSFPLCMYEIGKILIYNTMYLYMYR